MAQFNPSLGLVIPQPISRQDANTIQLGIQNLLPTTTPVDCVEQLINVVELMINTVPPVKPMLSIAIDSRRAEDLSNTVGASSALTSSDD
mmetsp:Transcript_53632/g.68862  ORF Transcript_53632/g.68862 Transcript_53632/m.68862 type:complete len:90 (-) Transcript_53632:265-534(-)